MKQKRLSLYSVNLKYIRNLHHVDDCKAIGDFSFEDYQKYRLKMDGLYKKYYKDEEIDYLKHRELDRALWVYGHGYC